MPAASLAQTVVSGLDSSFCNRDSRSTGRGHQEGVSRTTAGFDPTVAGDVGPITGDFEVRLGSRGRTATTAGCPAEFCVDGATAVRAGPTVAGTGRTSTTLALGASDAIRPATGAGERADGVGVDGAGADRLGIVACGAETFGAETVGEVTLGTAATGAAPLRRGNPGAGATAAVDEY
jgi:hypothetical protein